MESIKEVKGVVNESVLKEQAKKISVKEASAYSLMDGFGIRYISPFAIAIGASNSQIGLLSTLPGVLGNLTQLYSSKLIERIQRRKIVFWSVLIQALMWFPIIGVAVAYFGFHLDSRTSAYLLILSYTLLSVSGAFGGPAWTSWMKDLVTENGGSYFGRRSKIAGVLSLIFMFAGGFVLDYLGKYDLLLAFSVLFSLAFLGRAISAYLFTKQYEPSFSCQPGYYFSFWQFVKKMPYNNFGRFVIFASLVSFAQSVASPFMAVYMLKNLGFNYLWYTLITVSSGIISPLSMPFWGKFADRYGNLKVVRAASYFIPLIPLFWMVSWFIFLENPILALVYLIMVEGFSGFIWAGYNLSVGNFIYDAVTKQRMALCVTYYGLMTASGAFIGAFIGGKIASSGIPFFGLGAIMLVFAISGLLRLIAVMFGSKGLKEVREVEQIHLGDHVKKKIICMIPLLNKNQPINQTDAI